MIAGTPQKVIENYIDALLQNSDNVFLVEAKISSANNILVFLDADNGITIDKCVQVNRALYKMIEENALFEGGDFSLEVSSPGVDEPLKLNRQYTKNIGRPLEIFLTDDTKKQGKLTSVKEAEITIEETEGKGKKLIIKSTTILFTQIKHSKVLVTF